MRNPIVLLCIALAALFSSNGYAQTSSAAAMRDAPRLFVLLVTGIGGEAFYTERFASWTDSTHEVLTDALGVPETQIVRLGPTAAEGQTKATRATVLDTIATLASQTRAADMIALWYIGHATARGHHLALNLPGPDLSAQALGDALDAFDERRVLVVLAAAATGAMLPALSAPNRLVITATASAAERHAPLFAGPFATAFAVPGADTDKDRRVSVLEAFVHANHEVRASYKRDNLLVVEHALLDDNADGRGARAEELIANRTNASTELEDGLNAAGWFLDVEQIRREVDGSPERLRLRLTARALVAQIEQLKRDKQKYFADTFDDQLETLLVELALNRRAYRRGLNDGDKP